MISFPVSADAGYGSPPFCKEGPGVVPSCQTTPWQTQTGRKIPAGKDQAFRKYPLIYFTMFYFRGSVFRL
ncbi:MAG: hypothetical protein AVDCRST_MAG56-4438 [uncultured Cytophagales bacterium]|uniref:Uncharacterized protein n=1 Tax=uncultured Cytophagales bacterium TaxID=158755 RepID=A0A6J4JWU6_9SPHI|nr:MAG: hypothetical protein AVDCRST_MAG56-4438 [uncultured Cytophagales bacterium]